MAKGTITARLGLGTAIDGTRRPEGFAEVLENWVLTGTDPDRIHKILGRTLAKATPTSAGLKGITHGQFDGADNIVLLLGNASFYEFPATGDTLGTAVTVQDQGAIRQTYVRSGSFVKAIDGLSNNLIAWTGATGERALVRDMDGVWRYLSMKAPGKITAHPSGNTVTSPPTVEAPDSDTGDFDNGANAYDDDYDTSASTVMNAPGTSRSHTWSFAGAGNPNGYILQAYIQTSGRVRPQAFHQDIEFVVQPPPDDDIISSILVEVSEDGGDTWDEAGIAAAGTPRHLLQYTLGSGVWSDIKLRVTLRYTLGTAQVSVDVTEIWATTGGATGVTVATGTYYYAVTEVYRRELSDGRIVEVESIECEPYPIVVSGTVHATRFTLPERENQGTDGIPSAVLFRRVYRSTKTGVWPNLGKIADLRIGEDTFTDPFNPITGELLGAPSLYTVDIGGIHQHAAGLAPPILDATIYKGSLVVVSPDTDFLHWSLPGQIHYFPAGQVFTLQSRERQVKPRGVVAIGKDTLLVFFRTRVERIEGLQFAGEGFDTRSMQVTPISPNEGLAGTPRAYCLFNSQRGHALVGWVSDSGIWATDGFLPAERGMGIVKLTTHLDWDRHVDTGRLDETELAYDPVLQAVLFDYYDRAGRRRTLTLHTSAKHWIPSSEDQLVPKATGPHTLTAYSRAVGLMSDAIRHWVLDIPNTRILNERTGQKNVEAAIISQWENDWAYPSGADGEFQAMAGIVQHSDWGLSDALALELQFRYDDPGTIVPWHDPAIPLRGRRASQFWVNRIGQAVRMIARHVGATYVPGVNPDKALGPVILEGTSIGEIETP